MSLGESYTAYCCGFQKHVTLHIKTISHKLKMQFFFHARHRSQFCLQLTLLEPSCSYNTYQKVQLCGAALRVVEHTEIIKLGCDQRVRTPWKFKIWISLCCYMN